MLQSLYSRLVLLVVSLFICMGGLFIFLLQHQYTVNQDLANQRLHENLASRIASDQNLWPGEKVDKLLVKDAFHMMMVLGPAIELYVVDLDGVLQAYDASPTELQHMNIDIQPVHTFLANAATSGSGAGLTSPIYGTDPRSDRQKVFSASRLYDKQAEQLTHKGYLYVIIGGQTYDKVWRKIQSSQGVRQLTTLAVVSVLALLIVAIFIVKFITAPIAILNQKMLAYQASQRLPEQPLPRYGSRDVKRLNQSFVSMATKIGQQLTKLELHNQQRKDMLIQISHDLRTPIAAQQAYLETLHWQQAELSSQQQRHFALSAYENAKVLERRVEEILQLARLENELEQLTLTPVTIKNLFDSVAQAVRPIAEKKSVQLLLKPCSASVQADQTKLERVLINLVENALEHSDGAGVALQAKVKGERVHFVVQDSGSGIKADDIALVFQPYYRQQAKTKHLGLGLAICHKLVALHGGELKVKSIAQRGTRFYFDLCQLTN